MKRMSLVLAVVPLGLALGLLPAELSDPGTGRSTAVQDRDEIEFTTTIGPNPPDVPTPPAPVTERASPPIAAAPGTRTVAKKPTPTGESASDRAARVSRDAMIPHPRPPVTPYLAPDIQRALDSANNAPPIVVGATTRPTVSSR